MTTETTYPTLPDDALACGFCGVAVHHPAEAGRFAVTPMAELRSGTVIPYRGGDIRFATCSTCAARHADAQHVLAAHPAIRRRFGTDNAQHRLSGALDGCAALGVNPPGGLDENRDLTLHMIRVMAAPGSDARWVRLFAPAVSGVGPGRCAATPWQQATPEDREELRRSYASVLAYRVAQDSPDRALACPDRGGCLLCGVATVTLPATRVVTLGGATAATGTVWTPRTVPLASIGGKGGGRAHVAGYVCPACDDAVTGVGSIGYSAMARALSAHLRAHGDPWRAGEIETAAREDAIGGLVGHAVVGGTGSREPWAHVEIGGAR